MNDSGTGFLQALFTGGFWGAVSWVNKQQAEQAWKDIFAEISRDPQQWLDLPNQLEQVIATPGHQERQRLLYNNSSMTHHEGLWLMLAHAAEKETNPDTLLAHLREVQEKVRLALVRGPGEQSERLL
ncbi:MAG: hypothetical protein J0L97_08555 [Alphaproteobacteria bacterium]|nr:hypothetical protein [Alphaproteobacteria bacterium]